MGIIGARGRQTGKGRKPVYTTDDNFLAVSGCFFEISIPKSERVLGWGWQGWSSENAVPQKLFHIKRGSLSSCPCTEGPDPTVHKLPPPPKASAFQ